MSDRGVIAGLPYLANLIVMNNGRGERLRVIFIEDTIDDAEIFVRLFRKHWHEVTYRIVETEAALFLALTEEVYDLALCDYKMPMLTATRALDVVRESQQRDIPFIVLSGTVAEDSDLDVLKRGANDFVPKDEQGDTDKKHPRLIWAMKRELRDAARRMGDRIKLGHSYEMTIQAWGEALELRDPFTSGHTLRVTDLTLRLARRYNHNMSHKEFINIQRGALTHDIGKMGIPDNILNKPGPLTVEEKKIMDAHPVLAYKMLSHIPFLRDSLDIPYCHHEKVDGSGYPRGLKGEAIPIAARLFSLADVYDALTSDRPYRKAWTKERALNHIRLEKNISFDPQIADMFIAMMESRDA